ncbi:uncharacterized protein LOC135822139 isoform X2 [Sycon ciliatum]|uniref:uncharacterized protein LOC135822139 isoform X2 n=1 Tax=Sycon ciliatum TaxID=27933 RepID=UPI0031F68622
MLISITSIGISRVIISKIVPRLKSITPGYIIILLIVLTDAVHVKLLALREDMSQDGTEQPEETHWELTGELAPPPHPTVMYEHANAAAAAATATAATLPRPSAAVEPSVAVAGALVEDCDLDVESAGGAGLAAAADSGKQLKHSSRPGRKERASKTFSHFVAIPVVSRQVEHCVREVQEGLIKKRSWMKDVVVPPVNLNILLLCMNLTGPGSKDEQDTACTIAAGPDVIIRAEAALQSCEGDIAELLTSYSQPPLLPLGTISNYGHSDLFISSPSDHASYHLILNLQKVILRRFQEVGITAESNDLQHYRPHVPLVKDRSRRLWHSLWKSWAKEKFGDTPLLAVQLLEAKSNREQPHSIIASLSLGKWPDNTLVVEEDMEEVSCSLGDPLASPSAAHSQDSACGKASSDGTSMQVLDCMEEEESVPDGIHGRLSTASKRRKPARKTKSDGPRPPRPTHFLGIALKSIKVRKAVENLQAAILAENGRLKFAVENPVKLHVTFFMLTLGDGISEESLAKIARANEILQSCQEDVYKLVQAYPGASEEPPTVKLDGLNNFGRHVVFGDFPEDHPGLVMLRGFNEVLRSRFTEAGLLGEGGHAFRPHATIFKDGRNQIRRHMWEDFVDTSFGDCRLEEVLRTAYNDSE